MIDSIVTASWKEALRVYAQPRVIGMLFLGFSAGLPLLLVLGTLSFWLREAGIDRTTIGYLSWIGLAYGFKWAWSPLVDRLRLPLLTRMFGRRRGWMLLAQTGIIAGLVGMALTDPAQDLHRIAQFAILVAFASATQDIALDAYRIEAVKLEWQGAMAATYQTGYRIAMITASAGVLWIAASFDASEATYEHAPWQIAYLVMAGMMGVGVLTTLVIREPEIPADAGPERILGGGIPGALHWFANAVIKPFADFFTRYGWHALVLLALIGTYRISDVVMGIMANPFYVDMGYTKDEVATVSKVYGVIMTIAGAWVGGLLSVHFGILRILMLGAILSAATNVLFAWLAGVGHDVTALIFAVSADNLAGGIASAAFVAYLSGLVNRAYSATQYALYSSIMLLLPKFIAGYSGVMVDAWGYASFFYATALIGVPVIVLVWLAGRVEQVVDGKT
ncbi:MAG TPA: MFS transporter [Gallionella sp.]|jgi:PAT family beta-lactamase induction signal transducer AmpG|nr:MFS transporter [Gallionella sp.]